MIENFVLPRMSVGICVLSYVHPGSARKILRTRQWEVVVLENSLGDLSIRLVNAKENDCILSKGKNPGNTRDLQGKVAGVILQMN